MIYLDSSVALAALLAEPQQPPTEFWAEQLLSSRLLEYEVWNRIHALGAEHLAPRARTLIGQVFLFELSQPVLARALEPFRSPLRTLDALHLATAIFVRNEGRPVRLASYDARLIAAAKAMNLDCYRP